MVDGGFSARVERDKEEGRKRRGPFLFSYLATRSLELC